MKKLIVGSLLSVAALANQPALKIDTHTASEAGFVVNSHLIQGEREAILVDAQFTRSEAKKVVDLIKKSKKTLTTIFITHGHPDHYFGLEIIAKAFPKAKVLGAPGTIADIKATAQGKIDYWGKIYKDDLTKTIPKVNEFTGKTLQLEKETIEIVELGAGESEHASVLYVPSLKALIAGDMISGDVHLWLAENRPAGWLENLGQIRKDLKVEAVYSGHGKSGDQSLLDVNEGYINHFVNVTKAKATKKEAADEINKKYGTYLLPIILDLSLDAAGKK